MFEPEQKSWEKLHKKLRKLSIRSGFFVKADVAHYFERIPQHHLVALMRNSGCEPRILNLIEELFWHFASATPLAFFKGSIHQIFSGTFIS